MSEIKKLAKKEPVVAAEGVVSLFERLWPALEQIDTSSGSLGNAIYRTLQTLLPILVDAPADMKTRSKWMERLYDAVLDDGVDYLSPIKDRWGELCVYSELQAKWADELLPAVRRAWAEEDAFVWLEGVTICLSCLP